MRLPAAIAILWSASELAEQPHGTYTLDRSSLTHTTDGTGRRHPSCGGEKLFDGQATFVVEYEATDQIFVNRREWRFVGYAVDRDKRKPRADAPVIIRDPESRDTIHLWFGVRNQSGAAAGLLHVVGTRDGKACVDAWRLLGNFKRA